MDNQMEKLKEQHFNTYKSAIIETIKKAAAEKGKIIWQLSEQEKAIIKSLGKRKEHQPFST